MTDWLVYNLASQAQAAQDEIWTLSCGPGVRDDPVEVTRRWAIPKQRNIGGWAFEAHPTVSPITPPVSIEPYDPEWFTPVGAWNPNDRSPGITLSADFRDASNSSVADWASTRAQRGRSTGKFYFEVMHLASGGHGDPLIGLADLDNLQWADGEFLGSLANQFGVRASFTYVSGFTVDQGGSLGPSGWVPAGSIAGVAVDLDARKLWVATNNIWHAPGNPAAGSGWFAHWDVSLTLYPATSIHFAAAAPDTVRYCGDASDQNFAPPVGFIAWDLE